MSSATPTKLDWALSEAAQGRPQFPITKDQKKPPLILEWQKLATCDAAQINAWAQQHPNCNWGTHCAGHLVLDVDPNKGGQKSFEALQTENPDFWWITLATETPSGGRHLWFACRENVSNGVNVYGPGLDVRSAGGYVLTPGSTVGGKVYKRLNDHAIGKAPAWMKAQRAPKEKEKTQVTPVDVDQNIARQQMLDWLAAQPPTVEGERNHRGYAAAAKGREFGLTEENIFLALRSDWKCEPSLDDAELRHVIRSAFKYAQNPFAARSPEVMFDKLPDTPKVEPERAPAATKYPPRENLDDIRVYGGNGNFIDGLCNRGELIQVIGTPGARKSAAMGWLAYCVATGTEWFGRKVAKGAVLYVAAERKFEQAKRLDVWALSGGQRLRDIPVNVMGPGASLDDKGFALHIAQEAAAFAREKGLPVGLVVLDTLFALMPGHDTTSTEISIFTTNASIIAAKTGAPVAVIHHTPKSDKPTGHGSQALDARYDATLLVTETGDGGLIEVHKANTITERMRPIAWSGKLLKVTHKGEILQAYRPELGGSFVKSGSADEKILAALRSLIAQKMEQGATDRARCVTKKELRDACGVKSKTTFNEAFKRLLKREVAIKGDYVWTVTGNLSAAAMFGDLSATAAKGNA